jgi:hypothetical protein
MTRVGFPHSEISGSKLTYSSPKHIVVSNVLLRLLVPRHPPCALNNLIFLFSSQTLAFCFVASSDCQLFTEVNALNHPRNALTDKRFLLKTSIEVKHNV